MTAAIVGPFAAMLRGGRNAPEIDVHRSEVNPALRDITHGVRKSSAATLSTRSRSACARISR